MAKTSIKKSTKSSASGSDRTVLSRSDWVRAGLSELGKAGPSAVNIARLADLLGVTKGSFYWHFRSKDDLLDAILDEWRIRATERVIEIVENSESDARKRISQLAVLGVSSSIEERGGSIELAMRTWARSNKRVRAGVALVDKQRIEYLTNLFDIALPKSDPELMACIHYAFSTGLRLLLCYSDSEKINMRRAALEQVFFPTSAP